MTARYQLYYITDRKTLGPRLLEAQINATIRVGVDVVQIRDKESCTAPLAATVSHAAAVLSALGKGGSPITTMIVVNDRLDVALAAGAAGVHLRQSSLPAEAVRPIVPPGFLVGVSCHSLDEALRAEAATADYILLGPVFETPSKMAYGPPLGLAKLRQVTARLKIPVVALGGITVERVRACLDAGAAGIAGIRLFQDCPSLEDRVRELRHQFQR